MLSYNSKRILKLAQRQSHSCYCHSGSSFRAAHFSTTNQLLDSKSGRQAPTLAEILDQHSTNKENIFRKSFKSPEGAEGSVFGISSGDPKDATSQRVRQIRERVRQYKKLLSNQPKNVTINFTEKRTNTFVSLLAGKEPKMYLVTGFSLGRLLKVNKKARRSPANTKAFVEAVMRRLLPRVMAKTNATVFNLRIRGTRKVARPLLQEVRNLLQEQMKEVRETGSLSHPLWTLGTIKNITPYDMGSHKKRKRWRHL